MTTATAAGPLAGLRVIELSDEKGEFAGKLLADAGADVVKVEPPGGALTRTYAPFLNDEPGADRSLWFWHYNTSKRGVTLDIETTEGRALVRRLAANADILIESEAPGRMAALGLDYADLAAGTPRLIYVSITPFGRSGPRAGEQATDLTILAGAGPAWSCGYDDHTIPPVRGGGNQGYQTGCHFAVMAALVAVVSRHQTGRGQHVDVNMHAASNVTTEAGSYEWLVARGTVQRQTGRHAGVRPSMPIQVRCADGRYVNTSIPPRTPEQFGRIVDWLRTAGLLDQFDQTPILEAGMEGEPLELAQIMENPEVLAKFSAGRDALVFLAANLSAYDFFVGGQERGFQVAIIYAPDEALNDRHFIERGFRVEVEHPELGRSFHYPGHPYRFTTTPWSIRRRAPLLGEDNAAVYGELGLTAAEIARLRAGGVI